VSLKIKEESNKRLTLINSKPPKLKVCKVQVDGKGPLSLLKKNLYFKGGLSCNISFEELRHANQNGMLLINLKKKKTQKNMNLGSGLL